LLGIARAGASARSETGFSALGQAAGGVSGAAGSDGADASLVAKPRVDVRSPTALGRQVDRFGTGTPNRVSRKRIIDVLSKVCELT
jgi:hypothetical protein